MSRTPNVNLKLARMLSDNLMQIEALRNAISRMTFGSEPYIAYSDALNPLFLERDRLVELAFRKHE